MFYDLVKIRKAVDEATDLAVRAQSGLSSAALSNSLQNTNGLLGGAGAAALGLGYSGSGTAKLSRERKHRMRELSSQKLSQAYHLDEIAASVATMQSASTLEDVAQIVLQRNGTDFDARYVHFFHEKIPSRMMAKCTPLDPLNRIIQERPSDGSPWRTRALTRLFKEDWAGAAKDLTEALVAARLQTERHRKGRDQLVLAKSAREEAERRSKEWRTEFKVEDEDQPNSLEEQCIFHRAGVYLTIACQHVHAALDGLREYEEAKKRLREQHSDVPEEELPPLPPALKDAHRKRLEARKMVKTNAKRALRDYTAFLANFDYTPGLPQEIAEEFIRRVNSAANGNRSTKRSTNRREIEGAPLPINGSGSSDALVPYKREPSTEPIDPAAAWPQLPPPKVYEVSMLFSPTPPPHLPEFPAPNQSSVVQARANGIAAANGDGPVFTDSHEAITYHPLLTDALHSLLLCHSLLQTSPTELSRHAYNTARLARVCDGYPIFLAARSPARADWVEVLRRANNWVGLTQSWEALCRPAPLPTNVPRGDPSDPTSSSPDLSMARNGSNGTELAERPKPKLTREEEIKAEVARRKAAEKAKRERLKHEAILEALADERVVDEESFQRAVQARRQRQEEDERAEKEAAKPGKAALPASTVNGQTSVPATSSAGPSSPLQNGISTPSHGSSSEGPKRWAQEEGKEYPISTERAEAISRWVREAPLSVEGGKKKGAARKGRTRPKRSTGIPLGSRVQELDDDDDDPQAEAEDEQPE